MSKGFIVRRGGKGDLGPSIFIEPGLIVEFFGLIGNIPPGWVLCDGENGSPDLLDEFVVCSGDLYTDDSTGGFEDVTLVGHSHTGVTNTTGSHNHQQSTAGRQGGQFGNTPGNGNGNGTLRSNNIVSTFNGAHTHTFTINDTAAEDGIEKNLPPYRSLFYIMKIDEGGL